ncbi:MAG: hypothetical protein ACI93N_000798 [Flavobacteriaceae bacterium]|jgi:hypothetical protein
MKKILYIDNWDKGYRNFLRLDPKFKEKGYETVLVHTTSWNEKDVQIEREIEGLQLRDISFYKTIRIKKIIKKENPSIIIMLNLSFILDRAIVKICKDLNIDVFYLAHGKLFTPESQKVIKENLKESGNNKLHSKLNRKNRLSMYNYFVEMKSISTFFNFFIKASKNYTQFTAFPIYNDELKVQKSFVYYPDDLDVMVNEFGFPKDNVLVVGNPELDDFYNTKIKDKKEYCANELKIEGTEYVAYIDDGLSSIKNDWDTKMWLEFLEDINTILVQNDLELVIKLHPRRVIDGCIPFLEEKGIRYFKDLDFKNYIEHSAFLVSHFSSVIIYALLLNKNVKSPRWEISKGIEENFPHDVINYYYNKEDFVKDISNQDVQKDKIKDYLSQSFSGFDGKCIDRIVNEILKNR